jgi:hypothetical protein
MKQSGIASFVQALGLSGQFLDRQQGPKDGEVIECVRTDLATLTIQYLGGYIVLAVDYVDEERVSGLVQGNTWMRGEGGYSTIANGGREAEERVKQALEAIEATATDCWNPKAPELVLEAGNMQICAASLPLLVVQRPASTGDNPRQLRRQAEFAREKAKGFREDLVELARELATLEMQADADEERANQLDKGAEVVSAFNELGIDIANAGSIKRLGDLVAQRTEEARVARTTLDAGVHVMRAILAEKPMRQLRRLVADECGYKPNATTSREELIQRLMHVRFPHLPPVVTAGSPAA